jgi:hypothetical protein
LFSNFFFYIFVKHRKVQVEKELLRHLLSVMIFFFPPSTFLQLFFPYG